MKALLTRVAFGVWIIGAPFALMGCGDDASKPATTAPAPAPDAAKPDDAAKK